MRRNILNIPRENSLGITLSRAEETVESLIGLVGGEKNSSGLTGNSGGMSAQEADFILGELKEALSLVRETADSSGLDLSPETTSTRRKIIAALSVMWKDLEESKSSRLKRYGKVNARLRTELDPRIEEIIKKILNIRAVLERNKTND